MSASLSSLENAGSPPPRSLGLRWLAPRPHTDSFREGLAPAASSRAEMSASRSVGRTGITKYCRHSRRGRGDIADAELPCCTSDRALIVLGVHAAPGYGKPWIAFASQKFTRNGFDERSNHLE